MKLFVPSEFGNVSKGETEGIFGGGCPLHRFLHRSVRGLPLCSLCAFASRCYQWCTRRARILCMPDSWTSMSQVGK